MAEMIFTQLVKGSQSISSEHSKDSNTVNSKDINQIQLPSKELSSSQDRESQDNPTSELTVKESKICSAVVCILRHPQIENLFLLNSESAKSKSPPSKKRKVDLSQIISNFVLKILNICLGINLTFLSEPILDKYMSKALSRFREKQNVEIALNSLGALSCHLDLTRLTKCLTNMLEVSSQSPELFYEHNEEDGTYSQPSQYGLIFFRLFDRWLWMISNLSSEAESFLFPWASEQAKLWPNLGANDSNYLTASRISPDHSALDHEVQICSHSSSAVISSLDVVKLSPLFDMVVHYSDRDPLISKLNKLVSLLPSISLSCSTDVFEHLLNHCVTAACCGNDMQLLLCTILSQNKNFYTLTGAFITKHANVLMKDGKWWLMANYLEGAKFDNGNFFFPS